LLVEQFSNLEVAKELRLTRRERKQIRPAAWRDSKLAARFIKLNISEYVVPSVESHRIDLILTTATPPIHLRIQQLSLRPRRLTRLSLPPNEHSLCSRRLPTPAIKTPNRIRSTT